MAGEIARTAVEAGTKAVMDLSLSVPGCSISLKIDNVWIAGAVTVGATSLGAFYLTYKYLAGNATRKALERTDDSGVVNPEVRNITDGHSILVELHCHTETSFLLFLEDFEKKTVKFRLEEEFKKIGFKDELDVTIMNAEEVYEKARQIRERSTAPREGDETEQSKVDSSAVQQSVSLTDPSVTEESLTGKLEEDTALASSSKSARSSQGERAHGSSKWAGDLHRAVKVGKPTDGELERLSTKIGTNWKPLGRQLKMDESKIVKSERENYEYEEKAYKMLLHWKQRDGSAATYQVLYDALTDEMVNRKDLGEEICLAAKSAS